MRTLDKQLLEIEEIGYLTFELTLALNSLGCNIIPKLRSWIMFNEKNKNISEDDVWERIKTGKISASLVKEILRGY